MAFDFKRIGNQSKLNAAIISRLQAIADPADHTVNVTATADGLTTGICASTASWAAVTSASANNLVTLPASPSIGKKFRGYVGANGCKLITPVGSTTKINNVDCSGGAAKAAIPATSFFEADFTAGGWVLRSWTVAGVIAATITPA